MKILFKYLVIMFLPYVFFGSLIHAKDKIVIGSLYSTNIKKKLPKFLALSNYIESKMKSDVSLDVKLSKNVDEIIKFINEAKVDIYIDSLYPMKLVQHKTDIEIVCKNWKKGEEGYKSVLFVKNNSDINSLDNLYGKSIAFEDEYSTSGYYIPKTILEEKGYSFDNSYKNKKSIKYIFVLTEENVASRVMFKKVDIGATDENTFKEFDPNLFKIIYTSDLIPRSVVSFSKRISPKIKKEILDILYNMDKTTNGKKVLTIFSRTKKFTPLTEIDEEIIKK